ncbi:phage tail tape measure protein [Agromyces subbeticus]|uniref:phage tail tape measure protein n=1 Tax=Agromyces subbeticus TaxID=293890 RepID=UPI0003B67375|nr:phage tail tape measure protein [Agromyces subbeticus]
MFDAGALIFTIKAAGAQLFQQDLRQADQAIEKTGRSASAAKAPVEQLGNATDTAGKKSRAATQPLDEQARSTERVGDESAKAKAKQEAQAAASEKQAQTARQLSVALLAAGVAVTALVGLSVAKFASFDHAMSQTAAATMATTAEQEKLGDAALEAGADTAYSANQAAAAEEELAKAGLNVSQIIGGGLQSSLALAAAGQLEVARSATIMATTLKQFKLPASDAAHVADLLAAGAGKAQGSVDDLAQALQYVGPVAAGMGLSVEEVTGTLALFAENGQLGERAGTGLRGVIQSLVSPSAIAAQTMKAYGVEIFDGQGKMKSLALVSEELRGAFSTLTEEERSAALGRIFGNEQITAARVLYEGGAAAVDKWTDAVDDSGFAADQAARRQDNLAGDVEKLGGAFDTALIKTGSGANDVLRDMVQSVTALVDWYGELDPAVQGTALTLGIATGAMLLFSGGALGAISKFAELKVTLDKANISMGKTALIAGGVGLALTGVLVVISQLAQQQAEARAKAEAYADTLEEGTHRVTAETREMVATNLQAKQSLNLLGIEIDAIQFDSAADGAAKLGIGMSDLTDASMGNVPALERIAELTRLRNRTDAEAVQVRKELNLTEGEFASAIDAVIYSIAGENSTIEDSIRLAKQNDELTKDGAEGTRDAASAYLEAADEAGGYNDKLAELIATIDEGNGKHLDAREANRKLIESLSEFDAALAENGATLDLNTEAGRENEANLDAIATAAMDAATSTIEAGGSYEDYRASLESSRQALLDRINDLGITGQAAEDLADDILRIPSETEWQLIAETANARNELDRFLDAYQGRTIEMTVRATNGNYATPSEIFEKADGGNVKFFGNGGEHHVAQFARAGDWRVWAEPETGGEWYFPDSPSKRSQSVAYAEQMLDGWGYDMTPRGGNGSRSSTTLGAAKFEVHVHAAPGMNTDQLVSKAARAAKKLIEQQL